MFSFALRLSPGKLHPFVYKWFVVGTASLRLGRMKMEWLGVIAKTGLEEITPTGFSGEQPLGK